MEQHTLLYAWGITMSIIGTLIWQLPKRQSEDFTAVECMTIIPSFTTGMPSPPPPPYDTTVCYAPVFEAPDSQYVFAPFEVDRLPQFVGGEAAMVRFIRENLHWPQPAFCGAGTIIVQFTIGLDGCIADPVIVKDIGGGVGKAAIRMLYTMPPWLPGEIAGRTVKVRYIMPIRIHLE